jgi:diguanylate cyclase
MLRHLGAFLCAETRISDMSARMGGEEFVVLLPETEMEGAIATAEQLRLGIAAASKNWAPGVPGITVSVGVVHSNHDSRVFDGSAILAEADRCLYQAKRDGRNCTRYAAI